MGELDLESLMHALEEILTNPSVSKLRRLANDLECPHRQGCKGCSFYEDLAACSDPELPPSSRTHGCSLAGYFWRCVAKSEGDCGHQKAFAKILPHLYEYLAIVTETVNAEKNP